MFGSRLVQHGSCVVFDRSSFSSASDCFICLFAHGSWMLRYLVWKHFVWNDQCKYGLNTSISDLTILVCINTMISDRDQPIRMLFLIQQFRMLFLTQQVELASHGCVRQEIARVKQKSHCYQNARGTRDHTCQKKKSYFSEYAVRHEIARVRTGDRTSQSTR